jgi:polyhydroxyalkanoate synthesis regulator phasin
MSKCLYNYKGNTYSEEEVKPIVSYHYLVEDAVLQNKNFEKIGNTIVAKEGINIPQQTENIFTSPSVKFSLKSVELLSNLNPKQQQEWNKFNKGTITAEQLVTNIQIPKEQKQLVLEIINNLDKPTAQEVAIELANKYSYTVEINTVKERLQSPSDIYNFILDGYSYSMSYYQGIEDDYTTYLKNGKEISYEEYNKAQNEYLKIFQETAPTQYYSNLTVPGGTNYTEQEIATPAITPSIKGHAQFATDNGIGWFRSDDAADLSKFSKQTLEEIAKYEKGVFDPSDATKTRRILELQSDLFQKGRNADELIGSEAEVLYELDRMGKPDSTNMDDINEARKRLSTFKENQFLQLLNKNSNWVTFFVKSIIQDSAKKGYEKVLFPTGNTASKVEGHTTLEEFKREKENRIKSLEATNEKINKGTFNASLISSDPNYSKQLYEQNINEINQLKQELERVEGPEGFGALKPIWNFYENTVTNILNKQFGKDNVKKITDEYGNTWNELTLDRFNILTGLTRDIQFNEDSSVSEMVETINTKYGLGNNIVTLDNQGIVDIDVTPLADMIISKDQGISDGTQVVLRKAYNLEGVDEETLAGMEAKVALMESRFNKLGIVTHFIMDGDLNASGELLGTGSARYKEMVESGEINQGDAVVVVNPNMLYADTVFHEYGHIFIDLLGGMNNPRIKYAYSKIANSSLAQIVKEQYPELSGDALAKEIMATALGKEATEIFEAGNPEIGFIQKFLEWFRDSISRLFGIPVTSVKDLANELLGKSEITDNFSGTLDSSTQFYKKYDKDLTKADRLAKGAEIIAQEIASKINISLNQIGKSTQEDKVAFRSRLQEFEKDIAKLGNNKNLASIVNYLNLAQTMGNEIQAELTEFLKKANKGEIINIEFNILNKVDAYKGLFDLLDQIQNSAVSGYFETELAKEGWDEQANEEFIKEIDAAKAKFDQIHDLHIKVGRHHIADKLVKYSNRATVTRRLELEREYKQLHPRMESEARNAYNARIREKVDAQIVQELPQLKERERELIFNRLENSPADIGTLAQWVSSEKDLNSMIIQLSSKLLDEADLRRDLQMQDKKLKAFALFEAFDKETSGQSAKEKYKGLYQEGSDGNLYITGEYDVEWYIQNKALSKELADAEEKFGDTSKQYKDAQNKRNEWLQKNAIKTKIDGVTNYTPKASWKNKDYTKLMSNPTSAKAQMLQYLIEGSIENGKMLHGNRSLVLTANGSDVNFIKAPSIGKSTFEKTVDGDIMRGIQDSLERVYKNKTDNEDFIGDVDSIEEEKKGLKVIANRKGDIRHGVPIHFRGKMSLSDISYDLLSSHLMDSYMSMNYKYKAGLAVELELIKDIAAEKDILQTNGFAKIPLINAFDKKTQAAIKKKASEDSKELTVLKSLMENRLYGIKNANTEYAKLANSLMAWSSSTMLMFNLPSAMTNVLQGKVFNFIESQAGQFFNFDDLKKAESLFFSDMKAITNDMGRPISRSKTNQLIELFDLQGAFKNLNSKFIENTRAKSLAKSSTAYAMNHMGETYMHGTMMYAILNNIKIQNSQNQFIDKNGKVVSKAKAMSLAEAIEIDSETGKLKLNKHAYKTSFGNSPIGLGGKDVGLVEIKGLINKIAYDLHGNYSDEHQTMLQRYTVGKFIMMLRKWIVPGFNKRWRGAVYFATPQDELQDQVENFYSEDLQGFQEGYYTTALRFINNIRKDLLQLKFEAVINEWNNLSDMELANMRRTATEASIILLSLAASSILYGLAQGIDDDDNTRAALFHATYYTRRMYSEMMFFLNPLEAYKIMRTPAASLSYIEKLGRFATQLANDSYNVTFGEGLEEYETGKRKGEYKLWKRTGDVVPMVNQWNRDIEESTGWLYGNF